MGTIGGKMGLAAGIVAVFAVFPYSMDMLVGPCFWEEGCGRGEAFMVAGAALVALFLAIGAGLIVRAVVNRWIVPRASPR